MNKELELEAECYQGYEKLAFIEGATSKWVEKQKLEFAIEQLKLINEKEVSGTEHNAFYELVEIKERLITKLEKIFSEL